MVSPARRRDAVAYLVRRRRLAERRACRLLDQHRSTQRYRPGLLASKGARMTDRLDAHHSLTTERKPPYYGGFIELAGLEPATSWVRSVFRRGP
jgi:hypothetical protein